MYGSIETKTNHKYSPVNDEPYFIWSSAVSPPTLNLLKPANCIKATWLFSSALEEHCFQHWLQLLLISWSLTICSVNILQRENFWEQQLFSPIYRLAFSGTGIPLLCILYLCLFRAFSFLCSWSCFSLFMWSFPHIWLSRVSWLGTSIRFELEAMLADSLNDVMDKSLEGKSWNQKLCCFW